MNKIKLSLLIVSLTTWSHSTLAKEKPLKVSIGINNQVESNINLAAFNEEKNIHTTNLKIGTKLKKKIKKGLYLIDLPSIDGTVSTNANKKIRGYNISNTLIGLYILSSKHIFTSSSTASYTNNLSLNDVDKLQENHFFHLSLDFSYDWTISNFFKLNTTIGTKIREFSTPSDTSDLIDEENDDWKQFIKLKASIIPSKKITFGPIISAVQKLNKDKRALTSTGALGGNEAMGSRQYKLGSFFKIKYAQGNTNIKIESIFNDDIANGADDYKGLSYQISSIIKLGSFSYKIKANYKNQDYSSQQVDINEQSDLAALYKTNITTISNNLALPTSWTTGYNVNFEHRFQKLHTNRQGESYKNQTYKIAVNFTY